MKSLWKYFVQSTLAIGISAGLTGTLVAQDAGQTGIVRISKPRTDSLPSSQIVPVSALQMNGGCTATAPCTAPGTLGCDSSIMSMMSGMPMGSMGMGDCNNGNCRGGYRKYARQDWRYSDWQANDGWNTGFHRKTQAHSRAMERCFNGATGHQPSIYYHDPSGQAMLDYFKCKFGYFIPTGGGGQGIPWVGHYARVYPVNPSYSDPRDGQAWGAQGYGVPMAVPLAPVVGHTFDYSWGVPSSRLTPVSNPAY